MIKNQIEQYALNIYLKNIDFISKNDQMLFQKIKTFEKAIEEKYLKERYILEYKEEYFDVYDVSEEKWLYSTNSEIYSTNIVENINFDSTVNSFKTFYDYKYEDEVIERAKEASIFSDAIFGISPIIHHVNKNLPKNENLKVIYNYIIFGTVLGLHLPKIHKKINAKIYHIIEPSLELFRLSLFVTDYSIISERSQIIFYIADQEEEFFKKFKYNYYKTFFYNHYIKFFMFTKNCEFYINIIQDIFVSQSHYMYSYNRELNSLKRTFEYFLLSNFKYLNVSKVNTFTKIKDLPVLILGAGPSLQKNIDFVKESQKRYIIVAVYGTMPFLEVNGIIPDIIVQYDEGGDNVYQTIEKVKNLEFFDKTIFLFSSHLDRRLMEAFPQDNIYVYQALYKVKEALGALFAPSIGEITYALVNILGFRIIYLLGIDMSLDPETNKSHYDGYISNLATQNKEEISNETYSFRKNIIKVKGNFLEEVKTLPIYKVSIRHINMFTKQFNFGKELYNLSNGAYLEDIKPLKVKDLNINILNKLDKKQIFVELKFYLDSISSRNLDEIDLSINANKIRDAKRIKKSLKSFSRKSFKRISDFKNALHLLHDELCKNYICYDLQKILSNYFNNTIHYIFYLFNIEGIDNILFHAESLQKLFYLQLNKIVVEYIKILSESKNKKRVTLM